MEPVEASRDKALCATSTIILFQDFTQKNFPKHASFHKTPRDSLIYNALVQINFINEGALSPAGFNGFSTRAGIKTQGYDIALLWSDTPATCAATTNHATSLITRRNTNPKNAVEAF